MFCIKMGDDAVCDCEEGWRIDFDPVRMSLNESVGAMGCKKCKLFHLHTLLAETLRVEFFIKLPQNKKNFLRSRNVIPAPKKN